MPKTGWKYTKQMPAKGSTNMLKKSTSSSRPNRTMPKGDKPNLRSADTIKRLKMYTTGKAIRNKEGTIVGGQFMMRDRAGDTEIDASTGRIAPDRRWFGNTRVVGSTELDVFRAEMTAKQSDPYSVVLKRKKLPMGLLKESLGIDATNNGGPSQNEALLASEPFEHTFGSKSRRKRVKLDQLVKTRAEQQEERQAAKQKQRDASKGLPGEGGLAETPKTVATDDYGALLKAAQSSQETYDKVNTAEGIVPWGRDSNVEKTEGEGVDWIAAKKDDLFLKGQSRRIWGELWKVVDCSDVILHVIDARNVPGTQCSVLERHVSKNATHKHLVFVLNKIDLVPNWVAKRWMGELSAVRPTVAFHASPTHAFGKGALINLLRQFSQLHADKKQISVGIVGYPNVGKSSVINTLVSKKSCIVAPVPGMTKIWQYVTLMKRIYLIDSPGVVVDTAGDSEIDSVLKGVVRSERLENPEDFIAPLLETVHAKHVCAQYGLEQWADPNDLMEQIARKAGRLHKGGEPDVRSSAITMINDYQRGKLPHYVAPPELKETDAKDQADADKIVPLGLPRVQQDLDDIGKAKVEEDADTDADEEQPEIDQEQGEKKRKRDEEPKEAVKKAQKAKVVIATGEGWDDE